MVTKREAVILGVFTLVLIVGCIGFAVRTVGGGSGTRAGTPSAPAAREGGIEGGATEEGEGRIEAGATEEGAESEGERLGEYRIIAQRNLFRPALGPVRRPRSRPTAGGRRSAALEEIPPIPPVLFGDERMAAEDKPEQKEEPRPANPGATGGPPPAFPSAPGPIGGSQEKKAQVAVTGMIQIGGRWKVIVEDLQNNDKMLASVGEEAFGYSVREVDPSRRVAMLERGGRLERFGLGDNKVVKKAGSEKGPPGEGASPPGAPGGAPAAPGGGGAPAAPGGGGAPGFPGFPGFPGGGGFPGFPGGPGPGFGGMMKMGGPGNPG